MKFLKLFEEIRNDEARLKTLINYDMIDYIHDIFLEKIDDGDSLSINVYYCNDDGSRNYICYFEWVDDIYNNEWMTKYARIDKDYNKDKILYEIDRNPLNQYTKSHHELSDEECEEILDRIKSSFNENVIFE